MPGNIYISTGTSQRNMQKAASSVMPVFPAVVQALSTNLHSMYPKLSCWARDAQKNTQYDNTASSIASQSQKLFNYH